MHPLTTRFVACLLLIAVAVGCGRARDKIVGKWKSVSDAGELVWEFAENGTVTTPTGKGKYTFGAGNRLRIETPFAKFVYGVDLSGDTMTWHGPNRSTIELKRVP